MDFVDPVAGIAFRKRSLRIDYVQVHAGLSVRVQFIRQRFESRCELSKNRSCDVIPQIRWDVLLVQVRVHPRAAYVKSIEYVGSSVGRHRVIVDMGNDLDVLVGRLPFA